MKVDLSQFGINAFKKTDLKNYTTLSIGGPAESLVEVNKKEDLLKILKIVIESNLEFMLIGSGSDLLVSDNGYDGLVIVNKVTGAEHNGQELKVEAGNLLQDLVDLANDKGLEGLEKMAGIPGTVGGAIYGNAGAYGQTISDNLVSVQVFKDGEIVEISKEECGFGYRESIFKNHKKWIIISATLKLMPGNIDNLIKISKETIELRSKKYPPGVKCPGSFFKNILASKLNANVLSKIPEEKVMYGKIPAGFLLESVGANGDKLGGIEIASYHGNLFMNKNKGNSNDFFNLAKKYKEKVFEKFGIKLEPEVQLVGFTEKL